MDASKQAQPQGNQDVEMQQPSAQAAMGKITLSFAPDGNTLR